MNTMFRDRDRSIDAKAAHSPASPLPAGYGRAPTETSRAARRPFNLRWIIKWGAATAVFVALSVFMLQNTGVAEFSFLWMRGSAPVAMALLIATAGGLLLAQFGGLVRRRG
jgi:uncharacterized integral membrane protein